VSRLPCLFDVPQTPRASTAEVQLVPTLHHIGQNLRTYHDLYWKPTPNRQIVAGLEPLFADVTAVITETIRLSTMSLSLKNLLALRESQEKLATVANGFLHGIPAKMLSSPAYMQACDALFVQIAPALEAIRKLTEETQQVIDKGVQFLKEYGQILTGLRQVLPHFDNHSSKCQRPSRPPRQPWRCSERCGACSQTRPKTEPSVQSRRLRGGTIGLGFAESKDGARLNAEAKRIVVTSEKLVLHRGKAITPFVSNNPHAWFVERLALESKVRSNT
jgi:hypothetical protein